MTKSSKTKLLSIALLAVVMAVTFVFGITAFAGGRNVVKAATLDEVPAVDGYTAFGWTDGENLYQAGAEVDGEVSPVYARLTAPQVSLKLTNGVGMRFRTTLEVKDEVLKPRQLAKLAGIQSVDLVLSYVENEKTYKKTVNFALTGDFSGEDELELIATLTGDAGALASKNLTANFIFGEINTVRSDIVAKDIAIETYKSLSDEDKATYGESIMGSYEFSYPKYDFDSDLLLEAEDADVYWQKTQWANTYIEENKPNASGTKSIGSLNTAGNTITFEFLADKAGVAQLDLYMASNASNGTGPTTFNTSIFSATLNGAALNYEPQTVRGGTTYSDVFEPVVLGTVNLKAGYNTVVITVGSGASSMGNMDCLKVVKPGPDALSADSFTAGAEGLNDVTVSGKTDVESVTIKVLSGSDVISSTNATVTDGAFSKAVAIPTDFGTYKIVVDYGTYEKAVPVAEGKVVNAGGKSYTISNNNGVQIVVDIVKVGTVNALTADDVSAVNGNAVFAVTGEIEGYEAALVKLQYQNNNVWTDWMNFNATITDGSYSANVSFNTGNNNATLRFIVLFDGANETVVPYSGGNKKVTIGAKDYTFSNNSGVRIAVANATVNETTADSLYLNNGQVILSIGGRNTLGSGRRIRIYRDNSNYTAYNNGNNVNNNTNFTANVDVTSLALGTYSSYQVRMASNSNFSQNVTNYPLTSSYSGVLKTVEYNGKVYTLRNNNGTVELVIENSPNYATALTGNDFTAGASALNNVTVTGMTDGSFVFAKVQKNNGGWTDVANSAVQATLTDGAFSASVAIPADFGTYRIIVLFENGNEVPVAYGGNSKTVTIGSKNYTVSNNNGAQILVYSIVNPLTEDSLYVNNDQVIFTVSGTNVTGNNRDVARVVRKDDSSAYTQVSVAQNANYTFNVNVTALEGGVYSYEVQFANNYSQYGAAYAFYQPVSYQIASDINGTIKTLTNNGIVYTLRNNNGTIELVVEPPKSVNVLAASDFTAGASALNDVTVTGKTDVAAVAVKVMKGAAEISSVNATVNDGLYTANVAIPTDVGTYSLVVVFDGGVEKTVKYNGNEIEVKAGSNYYVINSDNGMTIKVTDKTKVLTVEAETSDITWAKGSSNVNSPVETVAIASGGKSVGYLTTNGSIFTIKFTSTKAGKADLMLNMASNSGSGTADVTIDNTVLSATFNDASLTYSGLVKGGTTWNSAFNAITIAENVDVVEGENILVLEVVNGGSMGNLDCLYVLSGDLVESDLTAYTGGTITTI